MYVTVVSIFLLLFKRSFMGIPCLKISCSLTSHLKLLPFTYNSKEIKQLKMVISRENCHGKEDMQTIIQTHVSSK